MTAWQGSNERLIWDAVAAAKVVPNKYCL